MPELAVDRGDALEPGIRGDRLRSRVDRPVEVVGQHQHLADEVLAGEPEVALALLCGPPLEVEELGTLALERGRYSSACVRAVGELRLQTLDVGEQLGRADVDVLGALLRRACDVAVQAYR